MRLNIRPPSGVTGQWLRGSSLLRQCSRLALRVWKSAALPPALLASVTVTSPQSWAAVTASRVGHSARPSRHGTPRLPFLPGLPGSVSGEAGPPDLAATPGHHPRPGLNIQLLRRVTGRPLRAVGHPPPPLPSRSWVAFETGHPPHFRLPVTVTRHQSWAAVTAHRLVTPPGHPVTGHPASPSSLPLNPGATRGRHPRLCPNRGWTAGQ